MADETRRHTEDMPLEPGGGDEREGRRIDGGSVTGEAGVSGTDATDFRVDEPAEEAEGGA
ncbi:MAG: hypothetical protein KY396_02440 [Actinobacteria bacterium]|nr:hypothetical protein [Actinomycetota bacterium]